MSYKENFQLGNLTLPNNIFYAPLAGCSDFPFRKISSKFQPGLIYCEMVKMDALIRYDEDTFHMLDFDQSMGPIGAQLCGSKPHLAKQSGKIIEDLGFSVLDLNCGCPVDKVTKDGSGSGLLKNPRIIGDIISNLVSAVSIPVTVKIRAGWDEESIVCEEITRIAEEAGAKAITIHARTRAQAYQGPAKWDWIKACKQAAKNILVIGNGDLFEAADIDRMHEATGCDAFLVARGTMGQPWIADDVRRRAHHLNMDRSPKEILDILKEHFSYVTAYQSDRQAMISMRRIGCWYLKNNPNSKEIRHQIAHAASLEVVQHVIDSLSVPEFCEC
jgi:tRNA-dihydrouridine synthase B